MSKTTEKLGRTQNSKRNAFWGMLCYVLTMVLSFSNRTLFVKFLSVDYLGVNGLFSNVLTILSFAELGIGNAIIYNMYKPLATGDDEKIKSLMQLYRTAYFIIGAVVSVLGLSFIPFLPNIIKEAPAINDNLIIIYLMFLTNTVISYFSSYKRSIIMADQKMYISVIYSQIFAIIRVIFQIGILIVTKNYLLYLGMDIICTLLNNLWITHKANTMYPILKDKNIEGLKKEEKKSIFKDVKALFLYRLGYVVLNGTDNILISRIVGVASVGLCSNYTMLLDVFNGAINQFLNSFTASIGNLNATEDPEHGEKVFKTMFFSCFWIFGFSAAGLYTFLNDFIEIWIGEKMVLPIYVVLALVIHFYINGVHHVAYIFRTTMGYFVQGRFTPILASIINIILSVYWGKKFGVAGIFFATSIARITTLNLIDPILVFKLGFKKSPIPHFIKFFGTLVFIFSVTFVSSKICNLIAIEGFIGLIIRAGIFSIVYNAIVVLVFFRTSSFKDLCQRGISKVKFKKA